MYALCYDLWRNYAEFWFLGVWGLMLALVRRCIFGKLCREAALGGGSKGKMLRQMTLKFEKSHEVHVEIHDISAFVRKYLYQEKRFGVRLSRWTRLPERWARLILYIGIAESISLYFGGGEAILSIDRLLAAALSASIVRIVTLIYESDSLWIQAENSLKDYAANSLYPRQHHEYEGFDEGTPEESAVPAAAGKDQAALQKSAEGEAEQGQKDEEKGLVLEQEEEQIFREVLSELLSS